MQKLVFIYELNTLTCRYFEVWNTSFLWYLMTICLQSSTVTPILTQARVKLYSCFLQSLDGVYIA